MVVYGSLRQCLRIYPLKGARNTIATLYNKLVRYYLFQFRIGVTHFSMVKQLMLTR
jgi:hypothetical protein